MSTLTASLERSLQNCSLNPTAVAGVGSRSTPSSGGQPEHDNNESSSSISSNTYVDLNSNISLPYHWEQCLDLKTGEVYYINWSNMMKVREDPRTTTAGYNGDYDDSDQEEEEDDAEDEDEDEEENNLGYDSEESSSTRENLRSSVKKLVMGGNKEEAILVVAGCKSCLMYHMLPKHMELCPKCSGQLLHFPPNSTS